MTDQFDDLSIFGQRLVDAAAAVEAGTSALAAAQADLAATQARLAEAEAEVARLEAEGAGDGEELAAALAAATAAQALVAALTAEAVRLAELEAEEDRLEGLEDAAEAEEDAAHAIELSAVSSRATTAEASLATVTAERDELRADAAALAADEAAEDVAQAAELAAAQTTATQAQALAAALAAEAARLADLEVEEDRLEGLEDVAHATELSAATARATTAEASLASTTAERDELRADAATLAAAEAAEDVAQNAERDKLRADAAALANAEAAEDVAQNAELDKLRADAAILAAAEAAEDVAQAAELAEALAREVLPSDQPILLLMEPPVLTGTEAGGYVLEPGAYEVRNLTGVTPVVTRRWLRNGTIIDGATGLAKPFDAALDDNAEITVSETAAVATAGFSSQVTARSNGLRIDVATDRIDAMAASYGGRPNVVPQAFYDDGADELLDASTHPMMGPFQHAVVKSGRWSDPTVWSSGVVPGAAGTAGQSVTLTAGFETVLDLESDVILRDVFGPLGSTLRLDRTRDTRLRGDSIMLMGVADLVDEAESATPGKARHEFVFHQVVAPGATTRLGAMFMGPTRIRGAKKTGHLRLAANAAAGAATIRLKALAGSGWRVGDSLVVLGTEYVLPAASDPHYDRPGEYHYYFKDNLGQRVHDQFQFGQDEQRTITAINGDVATLDRPLAYGHVGMTGTLKDGKVVAVAPVVANVSRSIRFRSATAAEDGRLDPKANHADLQKRAHLMFMRHPDVDLRYFEAKDMGRTSTDPSLFVAGLPYKVERAGGLVTVNPLRATNGGALLADPNNVRGRYAVHLHWCGGPVLGSPQVNLIGASAWAPVGGVPIPGWAISQHATRAAIEDCVVSNFRGGGIISELGPETGQWANNVVTGGRGDGDRQGWGSRAEHFSNHNDHSGVAYGNQSRAILMHGNVAGSCTYAFLWHAQKDNRWKRSPRDVDLRLVDPMTKGAAGAVEHYQDEYLGPHQAQIPPFVGNEAHACRVGFSVIHRNGGNGKQGPDRTPMLIERLCALNVPFAWEVPEYSNTYYVRDFLFQGPLNMMDGSVGARLGTVSWGWTFANGLMRNYATAFMDDGAGLNYEGFLIDVTTQNVTNFTNASYRRLQGTTPAASHPIRNVMGDWENHPTDAMQAIVRRYRNLPSTSLPQPYPLAPYGRKLPAGHPAVPIGGTPYFVLGDGTNGAASAGLALTLSAGGGRSQGRLHGVIRDCVGDRRYPDWQSSETFPNNTGIRGPRDFGKLTPEQAIMRSGCWNDKGAWKLRTWFRDADRFTHVRFAFHVDWTLNGFDPAFLAMHDHGGPPPAPEWPDKLEKVPAPRPLAPLAKSLRFRSRTTLEAVSGKPLVHRLRANEVVLRRSIVGGADAAHFAIAGDALTWAANGTRSTATPQDGNRDNAYEVTLRLSDAWGNQTDQPHRVVLLPSARVSPTIADTFTRADANLEATPAYLRLTGPAGAFAVRANRLAAISTTSAAYDLGSLGTSEQEVSVVFAGFCNALVLMRMVDENNWIGFRRMDAGNRFQMFMRVAGVTSSIADFPNASNSLPMIVRCQGRKMVVAQGGNPTNETLIRYPLNQATAQVRILDLDPLAEPGSLLLPATAPMGHKVGLITGTSTANPWIDNLSAKALPS